MEPSLLAHAPRRAFCVFEHCYQRREVADAVVQGRFPIHGHIADLGLEPDWLGGSLPADKEWRLEWHKFYFGLDLAAAGEATGDPTYADAWQRLVLSWIAQVPIDHDPSDVAGRRIQNWLYAWSRFAEQVDLNALAADFSDRIRSSLHDQVAHLKEHLTRERNHRTLELYALFIAAVSLPDLDPGGELLDFAVGALHQNLLEDILPDGVQRERSTHYHHVALRSFLGLRENARRFAIDLPGSYDQRLERACEFALHCHRPDGSIPTLSDSDGGSYLDLLALAGDLLNRPDFTYVATQGAAGRPPRARHVSFPDGGYFMQRSGWGEGSSRFADERYLIFDCGPIGDGGHGHYDALSVDVSAHGRPLIVDPGRYTYCDDAPHWRRWFKGTAAHNTVMVDGIDQTPYRRGKPKGGAADARLLNRIRRPGLDVLYGQVTSPAYDVVHRRRVLFVNDEYWILEDLLDSCDPHHYELRFHFTPEAQGTLSVRQSQVGASAFTPHLTLVVHGDVRASIEPGWVSEQYGIKHEAPVAVFTALGTRQATLVTLVAPNAGSGALSPDIAVTRQANRQEVEVVHRDPRVRDHIVWTSDGTQASWTRRAS